MSRGRVIAWAVVMATVMPAQSTRPTGDPTAAGTPSSAAFVDGRLDDFDGLVHRATCATSYDRLQQRIATVDERQLQEVAEQGARIETELAALRTGSIDPGLATWFAYTATAALTDLGL